MFFGVLLSLHLGLENSYNSIHPHVGFDLGEGWSLGAYYNSEYALSTYIANSIDLNDSFSIDLGLVTGYDEPIQPMIKLNYKNIFIVPATESLGSTKNVGLVAGVEWRY